MFIKDPIFNEFVENKKWKELYNYRSLEFIIAFIGSLGITFLAWKIFKYSPIEEINELLRAFTKDIAIALFGLMGFLITGLAILLSGISSHVMNIIEERGKEKSINSIFLGFYFEGLLIGILIVSLLILYAISYLNCELNLTFSIMMCFILSYLIIFVIIYSVGLIGNCISIFRIVNKYSTPNNKSDKENCKLSEKDESTFNSLKIMALEYVLIISKDNTEENKFDSYIKILEELINTTIEDELMKKRILTYFNKIYKK